MTKLDVVFRAAAGPRIGFGHVVRCRSLARALGVTPRVWVRGTESARRCARRAGVSVLTAASMGRQRKDGPQVFVLDDPSVHHARRFLAWAARRAVPVVSVHDLALALVPSALIVDGSVTAGGTVSRLRPRSRQGSGQRMIGPTYAVLDPGVQKWRTRRAQLAQPDRVVIALGGGRHVLTLGARLAEAIGRRAPGTQVRIARGFTRAGALPRLAAGEWITAYQGLGEELARASVAVVAGGVTLYEACAIGVPAVALSLTRPQAVTARRFACENAAIDAGPAAAGRIEARVGRAVATLLGDAVGRARLARRARALVDGLGAVRVGRRIKTLVGNTDALRTTGRAA